MVTRRWARDQGYGPIMTTQYVRSVIGVLGLATALALSGTGAASAQSAELEGIVGSVGALSAGSPATELPPHNPATGPWLVTDFVTPENPVFWNPAVATNRLVSPFGLANPVTCTSFHGVLLECFQQDHTGAQHKLVRLAANLPNVSGSLQPGGGPGTFVYADLADWGIGS